MVKYSVAPNVRSSAMRIGKLSADERAVGAIEYALVASLISVAAIVGYHSLGDKVESSYSSIDQTLDSKMNPTFQYPAE